MQPAAPTSKSNPRSLGGITVETWVRRSCDEQGLCTQVTDERVLRQVVNIMTAAGTPGTTESFCGMPHAKKGDVAADHQPPEVRGARAKEGAADATGSPD
jgi:hypothetical protein